MKFLRRIGCWLLGHNWHHGFWETKCRRCQRAKTDRLYQTGFGKGPAQLGLRRDGKGEWQW